MYKSKPEPEKLPCACGRSRAEAAVFVYRSTSGRFDFHRCECGAEWTEHKDGVDQSAPVTSDEVLAVHERLARFEGSIVELIGRKTAL